MIPHRWRAGRAEKAEMRNRLLLALLLTGCSQPVGIPGTLVLDLKQSSGRAPLLANGYFYTEKEYGPPMGTVRSNHAMSNAQALTIQGTPLKLHDPLASTYFWDCQELDTSKPVQLRWTDKQANQDFEAHIQPFSGAAQLKLSGPQLTLSWSPPNEEDVETRFEVGEASAAKEDDSRGHGQAGPRASQCVVKVEGAGFRGPEVWVKFSRIRRVKDPLRIGGEVTLSYTQESRMPLPRKEDSQPDSKLPR